MKRREFIIGAAAFGVGLLAGCDKGAGAGENNAPAVPSVAIVETRSHTVPSCLHWLDADFREIGSVDIDHAAIGGWNRPCVQNGKLFLVPTGLTGRNDDKNVLLAGLGASAIEALGVRRINNYCVAAARGFAFVGGNLNWESYVSRVDLETGEVIEASFGADIVDSLIVCDSRLFAVTWDGQGDATRSKLMTFDLELHKLSEVSLDECGYCVPRPRLWDKSLYLASWANAAGAGGSPRLGIYDVEAEGLEVLELKDQILEAIPTEAGLAVLYGDIHGEDAASTRAELLEYGTWRVLFGGSLAFDAFQAEPLGADLCILDKRNVLHRVSLGGDWNEAVSSPAPMKYSDSYIGSFITF